MDNSDLGRKIFFLVMIILIFGFGFKFKMNPEIKEFLKIHGASMINVALIILGLMVYFAITNFPLSPIEDPSIQKIVKIEAMTGNNRKSLEKGFCKVHQYDKHKTNKQCMELTKENCEATSCCVYTKMNNKTQCLAGDKTGPVFKRDENGKTYPIDFYYYKGKCTGKKC
tara:strand:- start:359 stop:865 length:507 start_codon:yes stop_codon:yes gene_type:complete